VRKYKKGNRGGVFFCDTKLGDTHPWELPTTRGQRTTHLWV